MVIMSGYCCLPRNDDVTTQQLYIDMLFNVIDILYKYNYFEQYQKLHNQDLETIYLSHLDHAVVRLKALLPEDIHKELRATYLEKAALIFQAAVDNIDKARCRSERDREFYKEIWQTKAHEYLDEAAEIRGQQLIGSYNERLRDLYQFFAANESILNHDLLLERYQEYQKKCTPSDTPTPPSPSNADGLSLFSQGLRHRPQRTTDTAEETAPLISETKISFAT
jgi:hypothetical protein